MSSRFEGHTPGPWRAEQHPPEVTMGKHPQDWEVQARDPKGRFGWCQHVACCRLEADARFIAAAPDLLALCKQMREALNFWRESGLDILRNPKLYRDAEIQVRANHARTLVAAADKLLGKEAK